MEENLNDRIDIGPVFKNMEPKLVRWIVALAMAVNDLTFCAKKIPISQSDYAKFYYFKFALSYIREIAKIVRDSLNETIILEFISKLNGHAQETYKKIEESLGYYDDRSIVKNVLKNFRDETFHYPDIKGEFWPDLSDNVKAMDKIFVDFKKNDRTIMGTRYRFIDILISQRINKSLSKEILEDISKITVDLISFVDYVFEHLTGMQDKSSVANELTS